MNKILIFFSALTLLSCIANTSDENLASTENSEIELPCEDDYKIINSTFVHLALPAPVGAEKEFGYDNYANIKNDIPAEFINDVFFTQQLANPTDSISFKNELVLSENSINKLKDPDFKSLAKQLLSAKFKVVKLDISKIQNTGLFNLIPVDINQTVEREIGESILTYSRIVYNKKMDKACFYFENRCSGFCGFGLFVFVENIDGVWTIKDEIQHWVS